MLVEVSNVRVVVALTQHDLGFTHASVTAALITSNVSHSASPASRMCSDYNQVSVESRDVENNLVLLVLFCLDWGLNSALMKSLP